MKFKRFYNTGNVVRHFRLELRLSQKKLGYLIGVGNSQVSNIEQGLCGVRARDILKVSRALKINSKVLIDAMTSDYKNYLRDRVMTEQLKGEKR